MELTAAVVVEDTDEMVRRLARIMRPRGDEDIFMWWLLERGGGEGL